MSPATHAAPAIGPTGPRTEEGKKKSALNATRHGLTSRVVVMPWEDMDAYMRFCAYLMTDLAPETALERQYAQTFCDTQWRLNRISSIEDSMFALGHVGEAGGTETDHPEVHAALTAARVFRDNSRIFVNLSLYEQRLQRTLEKSLKRLLALQTERRAQVPGAASQPQEAEAHALAEAQCNLHKMKEEGEVPAEAPATESSFFRRRKLPLKTSRPCLPEDVKPIPECDFGNETPSDSRPSWPHKWKSRAKTGEEATSPDRTIQHSFRDALSLACDPAP